ncbi:MAG: uracil-DNA glycosylase family protein [Myxococcota bacterium]
MTQRLLDIARLLSSRMDALCFGPPVTHVYNPLSYAWNLHRQYVERFGRGPKEVVFFGMNPGPWGMAQTGVPFGEVSMVREWMGLEGAVDKPARQHPKRPILGLGCTRSEVSGARLWGWAKATFGTAERFFARNYVANYCPLVFMEESGKNRTPDKLSALEREPLEVACDHALREVIVHLDPHWVVGVGAFAERRAQVALQGLDVRIGRILHPSPASPTANRDWAGQATRQLKALGVNFE